MGPPMTLPTARVKLKKIVNPPVIDGLFRVPIKVIQKPT